MKRWLCALKVYIYIEIGMEVAAFCTVEVLKTKMHKEVIHSWGLLIPNDLTRQEGHVRRCWCRQMTWPFNPARPNRQLATAKLHPCIRHQQKQQKQQQQQAHTYHSIYRSTFYPQKTAMKPYSYDHYNVETVPITP
jgi:hypothetical protein